VEIGESHLGTHLVLRPVGRLDNLTSGEFQARLLQTAVAGTADVIIDLGAVPYIASGGLRALMTAVKQMPPNRRIAVAALNPVVQEIFTIAGFRQVIAIFGTVEDVVEAWG
jgi:anti-anti-sigma factor